MPRPSENDRVKADQSRINASSKNVYEKWEEEYSCDMLEEYYYGKQWYGDSSQWDKRKYVINLFYPSINLSKPSLLFQIPKYTVTPRINRIDDPQSDVEARAKLQENTLNTFVQDPKIGYAIEAHLALLDAQFRFGIVQVGYTADYMDNPNADRPLLSDERDAEGNAMPYMDREGQPVMGPKVIIQAEGLFVKWISAKQARCSERNTNRTETNDWIAYFEWHYVEDIKGNPRYKNKEKLRGTGRIRDSVRDKDSDQHPGMIKVWFLWDLRKKQKRVFGEGCDKYFLEESFKFLPLAMLKFDEILGQWLPLPPSYNWVHPQNQLNDIREMRRLHRKRAVRRYLRKAGAMTPEEFQKLCEDEDMTCVEVSGDPTTAIVPMQDATLDAAIFRDEATMVQDFTRESGVSGEAQQVAQSETATQANLIALMGQTRENAKRATFALFLGEVGRLILLTLKENMALPFWIKKSVDPFSPMAGAEAQEVTKLWQQITDEDLGEIDNDIAVDLSSMSPVQQAQERQDWMAFLAIITNPAIGPIMLASPYLLRKTAGLFNIHSERDIQQLAQAAEAVTLLQAQAAAQQAGVQMPGSPGPGATPTNTDIVGQLQQQLPVETVQ